MKSIVLSKKAVLMDCCFPIIDWRSTAMNRSRKKCVLYPHVSTEIQVDGLSLDGQKCSLRRFADREKMEIIEIYEDAG